MRSLWKDNRGDTGIFEEISKAIFNPFGVFSSKDKIDMPTPPASPDPNVAAQTAKDAQNKQRKILLATGGKTQYAGAGSLLGDNINTINLTGV